MSVYLDASILVTLLRRSNDAHDTDALNIAMAQRMGAMLATLDRKMAAAARSFG